MKKYIAEFMGTAVLALAIIGSFAAGSGFVTMLTVGITLGLVVATVGSISGAHINPAVTLGLLSLRKIHWKEALFYILAQFAGAALAMVLMRLQSLPTPNLDHVFSWTSLIAEFIGAFVFTFGIASVVLAHDGHESSKHAPFVIGASLTIGATIAFGLGSNAVLNPAVAFGIGSLGLTYVIGPILGSLAGMWLFKALR